MIMYALTELGQIVELQVDHKEEALEKHIKVIKEAMILNTKDATFSIEYNDSHGDLVTDTITENPREVFDRLAKARDEIEAREIALMRNLFLPNNPEFIKLEPETKSKHKKKQ